MADATTEFFDDLASRGHEPLLEKGRGTLAFELTGAKRQNWLVSVDRGDVAVAKGRGEFDCRFRAPHELFDRLVTGEVNATAAVLRGALSVEGDWELLVLFQRLLPDPPKKPAAK
jgi:putative sterol carrier protein